MKKKIEKIIKTNSFINKLYTFIGSKLVSFIGLFFKKEAKTILFVSYMGKNFNDSPKMIYDALIKDPFFKGYRFIWAFNEPDNYQLTDARTETVKMDSLEYLATALRANYWVTNVNIERGLHFKKDYTKSINTWHGVPLKKVGNDVQGRNDFDFSDTNLFCYSGEFEYEIYQDAFKLKANNLFEIGMPRNDLVLENNQAFVEKIKEKYSIQDKKIILYAPTWREDPEDLKLMNVKQWEEKLGADYVLLVKAHGLAKRFNIGQTDFVIDVSDYEETAELIIAADILITDYSSIMFDFSLLAKPIFIYAPDYEKYINERGVYFDLKTSALTIFEEDQALLNHLLTFNQDKEEQNAKLFGDQFIEVKTPNATEKIISLMKEEKI